MGTTDATCCKHDEGWGRERGRVMNFRLSLRLEPNLRCPFGSAKTSGDVYRTRTRPPFPLMQCYLEKRKERINENFAQKNIISPLVESSYIRGLKRIFLKAKGKYSNIPKKKRVANCCNFLQFPAIPYSKRELLPKQFTSSNKIY